MEVSVFSCMTLGTAGSNIHVGRFVQALRRALFCLVGVAETSSHCCSRSWEQLLLTFLLPGPVTQFCRLCYRTKSTLSTAAAFDVLAQTRRQPVRHCLIACSSGKQSVG